MATKNGAESAELRFGGDITVPTPYGKVNVGQVITSAGPGKGFAMIPWALFDYERVLGLKPEHTYLLARMIRNAWRRGAQPYVSQQAIEKRADVNRNTVGRWLNQLERMGYIEHLPQPGGDGPKYYSLDGIYTALALCIAIDPASAWAKEHGALSQLDAQSVPFRRRNPQAAVVYFAFDDVAVEAMKNGYDGQREVDDEPEESAGLDAMMLYLERFPPVSTYVDA